jgi:hypothetical protein
MTICECGKASQRFESEAVGVAYNVRATSSEQGLVLSRTNLAHVP